MSFPDHYLFLEDINVGQDWESPTRTISETDVGLFAGLTGDFNPIHLDHEFAKTTPFRSPVAHGLLVLSAASGLALHAPPVRTLAFLELREWTFISAVFPGDSIRVRGTIIDKVVRGVGKRGVITWRQQVINQEGRIVQEGIAVTLVEGKAARRAGTRSSRAA